MADSSLRQSRLPQMQVPRPADIDIDEDIRTPEDVERDLALKSVTQLLVEAQELFNVRDPANTRINYIKNALISRLSATFDEHQQLTMFDELNGLAFRDPDDNQLIVVQSPDVPLQFRLRKSQVRQWKVVLRTVGQEKERRTRNLETLRAMPIQNQTIQDDIIREQSWIEALDWVLNESDTRKNYRMVGRFVASSERDISEMENQE